MIREIKTSRKDLTERTLIAKELLEPFLKFPSGLSVIKAKQNAKALKEAQDISANEALKLICWGNGIINVIDFDQAFDELLLATFGRTHEELGLMKKNKQIIGCWWSSSNKEKNFNAIQSSTVPDKAYNHKNKTAHYLNQLVEYLTAEKEQKFKRERFLLAVKDCIEFLGYRFYYTENDIAISDVTELHQIEIDIEQLLFQGSGSGGPTLMSYALSSCYNTSDTARKLIA